MIETSAPLARQCDTHLGPLIPNRARNGFVQLLYHFPSFSQWNYPDRPFDLHQVDLTAGTHTAPSAIASTRPAGRAGSSTWGHG